MGQPYWFYVKAILVMAGGLGALAALVTGDSAISSVRQGNFVVSVSNFRQVVHMHENFAKASVAVFGIIAAGYLILWLNRSIAVNILKLRANWLKKTWQILTKLSHFFVETKFVILLALVGLVCITITGGLGGTMVYGPNADPFFGVIYKLMFP